ncbi:kinase-like protein [Daldinia caldariorum]|uniref:kinase-like protein n=1 Tax=Daldinia caldariorum TaxID=326644 RepID=UPI0020072B5E|nr:kinase-like protein [Daldinia caldariorum]KAI1467653.1 kinase-like protein [Daldinia caldariorum]
MPNTYQSLGDGFDTQHDGTEHLAVNNTLYRRLSTLLSLKLNRWLRIYKPFCYCHPISKNVIVKWGPFVHLTEAATMTFVAKNTSIPVPRVHCSFIHRNMAYIVMERIEGDNLCTIWKTLSIEDLEIIRSQLQRMLQELRAVKPPSGTGVESLVGGSLHDPRMSRSSPRFGPFKTIQDFHCWLRGGLEVEDFPNGFPNPQTDHDWDDFQELVMKQKRPWPAPVLTHGDLNASNIIVRGNQVVGIIDWETAGWYPPYWEYTSACYLPMQDWRDFVPTFLEPYPEEFRMETLRQRWWGEI